jgi:hypothetical protein
MSTMYLFYRQLVVANELRIIALDEIDEDVIYRVRVQEFFFSLYFANNRYI